MSFQGTPQTPGISVVGAILDRDVIALFWAVHDQTGEICLFGPSSLLEGRFRAIFGLPSRSLLYHEDICWTRSLRPLPFLFLVFPSLVHARFSQRLTRMYAALAAPFPGIAPHGWPPLNYVAPAFRALECLRGIKLRY